MQMCAWGVGCSSDHLCKEGMILMQWMVSVCVRGGGGQQLEQFKAVLGATSCLRHDLSTQSRSESLSLSSVWSSACFADMKLNSERRCDSSCCTDLDPAELVPRTLAMLGSMELMAGWCCFWFLPEGEGGTRGRQGGMMSAAATYVQSGAGWGDGERRGGREV